MEKLQKLEEKIKEGQVLTAEEALWLLEEAPFDALCETAHRITEAYASRKFDMERRRMFASGTDERAPGGIAFLAGDQRTPAFGRRVGEIVCAF